MFDNIFNNSGDFGKMFEDAQNKYSKNPAKVKNNFPVNQECIYERCNARFNRIDSYRNIIESICKSKG